MAKVICEKCSKDITKAGKYKWYCIGVHRVVKLCKECHSHQMREAAKEKAGEMKCKN